MEGMAEMEVGVVMGVGAVMGVGGIDETSELLP
jgi:hypothetical protein